MATKNTVDERLEKLQKREDDLLQKVNQVKEKKRQLENQRKAQERKHRAKRLIEIGGTVEHVLGRPISHEDLPRLQAALESMKANLLSHIWQEPEVSGSTSSKEE